MISRLQTQCPDIEEYTDRQGKLWVEHAGVQVDFRILW